MPFAALHRALLATACAALGSCKSSWWNPELAEEPWSVYEPGSFGLGASPGLFTLYKVDAELTAETPAKGTQTAHDSGDFIGRFGLALNGELALRENLLVALGADYRIYDIEGLNPIQELVVDIDRVDSLQYYLALRYLLDPFGWQPRLRPFAQASIAYLPSVDVGFEVDLSEFGSSDLRIESEGEGYWVAGAATGLLYHWRDSLVVELGVLYEVPLTPLEVDLSFSISTSKVPMDAELEPQGLIGFCGVSWYL